MPRKSLRFAIGSPVTPRSAEWLIWWFSNKSDVYIVSRTLGVAMKVSIHDRGRCHIRAPDASKWRGKGEPPKFLDEWDINTAARLAFPFAVLIPTSELRTGPWQVHRDKGTQWLEPGAEATEIGVFLSRIDSLTYDNIYAQGWHLVLGDDLLPDGRRLLVVVGHRALPDDTLRQIRELKARVANVVADVEHPRLIACAANEEGTRRFIEIAAREV